MGLSPSPIFANLYLYRHGYVYMMEKKKNNIEQAYKLHACMRYLYDLLCLNDSDEFYNVHTQIYPMSLILKCENRGEQATFLDLDIKIINGKFEYKLYDKRDVFGFKINRMPDRSSNIPQNVYHGAIKSEALRIARSTMKEEEFINRTSNLVKRMINQGGNLKTIRKHLNKTMTRNQECFKKYDSKQIEILKNIMEEYNK